MATIILGSASQSVNISALFPNSYTSSSLTAQNEYNIQPNLNVPVTIQDQGRPTVNVPPGTVDLFQVANVGGTVQARITFEGGAVINLVTSAANADNYNVRLANGDVLSLVELAAEFGLAFPAPGAPIAATDGQFTIAPDGTVTQVEPPNNAPVAEAAAVEVTRGDAAVTGQLSAEDPDGDAITFSLVDPVPGLTLNPDGSFTFDPAANPAAAAVRYNDDPLLIPVEFVVTDARGASVTETLNITVNPRPLTVEFVNPEIQVREGEVGQVIVRFSEMIAPGDSAQITFQVIPGSAQAPGQNVPDQSTPSPDTGFGLTNPNDFEPASLNPVTVTVGPGEQEAVFEVRPRVDNLDEVPESFIVRATLNRPGMDPVVFTAEGLVLDVFSRANRIILTEQDDQVTPTSTNPLTRTTAEQDFIFAGTNASGTAHTLGTNDVIDGAGGYDVIQIVEDRVNATTLIPAMTNVERMLLQSATNSFINLVNTRDLERIEVIASGANTTATLTNLADNARLVFEDSQGGDLTLAYRTGPNGPTPAQLREVDVEFNFANGSNLTFTRNSTNTQADNVRELTVGIAGDDAIIAAQVTNPTTGVVSQGGVVADATNLITGLNLGATQATALQALNIVTSARLDAETGELGDARSDVANVSIQRDTVVDGLFNRLTSVDASGFNGTLNLDLFGNIVINTFVGGDNDTRLVLAAGPNANTVLFPVTGRQAYDLQFGAGNDLFITSSAGLSGADQFDGGDGVDQFEIHFGPGAISLTGGSVVAAINNATNFEELVIDRWVSNGDVTLNAAVINTFDTFIFHHTVPQPPPMGFTIDPTGTSGRLGTFNNINVTNTANTDAFIVQADEVNTLNFTAATGSDTLNLTLMGLDAAAGNNFAAVSGPARPNDFVNNMRLTGYTTVNLQIDNDNGTFEDVSTDRNILGGNGRTLTRGNTTVDNIEVSNNTVVDISGEALNVDFTFLANTLTGAFNRNITVDARDLNTDANGGTVARNVFDFSALVGNGMMRSVTVFGTNQADDIFGSQGNDFIDAGNGNNRVDTVGGNNTVRTGSGNDVVFAREGINDIATGAGNDVVVFTTNPFTNEEGLTSADRFDGGDGIDRLVLDYGLGSVAAFTTVTDGAFNQVRNVEELELAYEFATVNFNEIARAAGFTDVIASERGLFLTLGEGFTNDLRVELQNPTAFNSLHIVDGSGTGTGTNPYTGDLTIYAEAGVYDGTNTLLGGVGNNTIVIEADGNLARIGGAGEATVRDFQTIQLVQAPVVPPNLPIVDLVGLRLGSQPIVNNNQTLRIDASDLAGNDRAVIDVTAAFVASPTSSPSTPGYGLQITGGRGNDVIFGSAGDDVIVAGTGNDYIFGGVGRDLIDLTGTGNNTIAYRSAADSRGQAIDMVTGFTVSGMNADVIRIDTTLLTNLGASLADGFRFLGNVNGFANAQGVVRNQAERAADGDPGARLEAVFDSSDGSLWFDIDDNGVLDGNDLRIVLSGVTALQFDSVNRTSANIVVGPVQSALDIAYTVGFDGTNTLFADGVSLNTSTFTGLENRNLASFLNEPLDSLTIGGTVTLGAGVAEFAQVTVVDNANVTMTALQHDEFLFPAFVGNNVTINVSEVATLNSNANVQTYGIQGGSTLTVNGTGQNVVESTPGSSTLVFNADSYTGTFTGFGMGDTYQFANGASLAGATGLIGGTFAAIEGNPNTLTLNGAQNAAALFNNNGQNLTVVVDGATNFTTQAPVNAYSLVNMAAPVTVTIAHNNQSISSDGSANVTANYMSTAPVGALNLAGMNDVLTSTGLLNSIVGINMGGATTAETFDLTSSVGNTVTLTVAQNNGFTTFVGAADNTLALNAAGGLTPIIGGMGVGAYTLAGMMGQVNTFVLNQGNQNVTGAASDDTVDASGLGTVSGTINLGMGSDTLITGDTDITLATLMNIETLDVRGDTSMFVAQHNGFNTVVGSGVGSGAIANVIVDQALDIVTGLGLDYEIQDGLGALDLIDVTVSDANQSIEVQGQGNLDVNLIFGLNNHANTIDLLGAAGNFHRVTLLDGSSIAGVNAGNTIGANDVRLVIDDNASVTLTVTQYEDFRTSSNGPIVANGMETVTVVFDGGGLLTLDDEVENYVTAGTGAVMVQVLGADAVRGGQSVERGHTGAFTIEIVNATQNNNGQDALTVNGFITGNGGDVLSLDIVGGLGTASDGVFFNNFGPGGNLSLFGDGDILEINAEAFTFDAVNAVNFDDLRTFLGTLGLASGAIAESTLVVYDGMGNANVFTMTDDNGDLIDAELELVAVVNGVVDNSFTAANFA